ncbi:MAG TPA: hypothetical protein VFT91_07400 [Dehalococcoidia bacterium]|nr:hypothetical protein [Dehalococcoidia bacterium]
MLRIGRAEFLLLASLLVVAGVLAAAFLSSGWTVAMVPGLTYALAMGGGYMLYQTLARERAQAAQAETVRFQVVSTRGACPLGRQKGDVVAVGPAGAVVPALCAPAQAVLRLAAAGQEQEVKEWCCPIFDHMLVFRRQFKAA